MSPEVDVVIPVLNGKRFVCDAIDSVLSQSSKNFHVHIFDNNSVDGTVDHIKRRYRRDDVSIIQSPSTVSMPQNFNRCLHNTSAPFVRFLSADDTLGVDCLARSLEILRNDERVAFVGSSNLVINKTGSAQGTRYLPFTGFVSSTVLARSLFTHGNWIGGPSGVTMRRSYLQKMTFDEEFRCSFDFDFWFRLSRDWAFFGLKEPLYSVRIHEDQGTRECEKGGFASDDRSIKRRAVLGDQRYPAVPDRTCFGTVLKIGRKFGVRVKNLAKPSGASHEE